MLWSRILILALICGLMGCSSPGSNRNNQKMSDKEVCTQATLSAQWETRSKYLPYVKIAKGRGLTCGVKVPKGVCPTDLKKCNKEIICTGATTKPYGNSGKPFWVFKRYIEEARSRGLSCRGYL